jgi:regulatory protein
MLRRPRGESKGRLVAGAGHGSEPRPPYEEGERVVEARAAALRMIEVQLRPRRELARRLAARGFPAPAVTAVLDRLEAVGIVDDRAYAEGFIRRRLRLRPRGPRLLERELLQRGVPRAVVLAAIAAALGERTELDLARAALIQRASGWARLDPEVARRRAIAALKRLGFPGATIRAALDARR